MRGRHSTAKSAARSAQQLRSTAVRRMTLFSIITTLMHLGLTIVGLDYGFAGQLKIERSDGRLALWRDHDRRRRLARASQARTKLDGARYQGRKIAETAKKLQRLNARPRRPESTFERQISMIYTATLGPAPLGRLFLVALFFCERHRQADGPRHATKAYICLGRTAFPDLCYWISIIVEIGGGALFLLGYQTRLVGAGLALYSLSTALIFHHNLGRSERDAALPQGRRHSGRLLAGGGVWRRRSQSGTIAGSAEAEAPDRQALIPSWDSHRSGGCIRSTLSAGEPRAWADFRLGRRAIASADPSSGPLAISAI